MITEHRVGVATVGHKEDCLGGVMLVKMREEASKTGMDLVETLPTVTFPVDVGVIKETGGVIWPLFLHLMERVIVKNAKVALAQKLGWNWCEVDELSDNRSCLCSPQDIRVVDNINLHLTKALASRCCLFATSFAQGRIGTPADKLAQSVVRSFAVTDKNKSFWHRFKIRY